MNELRASSHSIKSVWKDINQDACCIHESLRLYAVADGEGTRGEDASRAVIDAALRAAKYFRKKPYAMLLAAFTAANEAMNTRYEGSTSLCIVTFDDRAGHAFVGSIGDSRCYWKHENRLYLLTSDTPNMGPGKTFSPGIRTVVLEKGDAFLLATKGVSNGLTDKQIDQCLNSHVHAQYLVSAAVNLPGMSKENATAVVIRRDATLPLSSSRRRGTR